MSFILEICVSKDFILSRLHLFKMTGARNFLLHFGHLRGEGNELFCLLGLALDFSPLGLSDGFGHVVRARTGIVTLRNNPS